MTRLGVAIVHYRAEDLCRACVRRLRSSGMSDFVAVIVDNGSDRPLEGFEDDPRFRLEAPGCNLGYAAGINLALERLPASTPYVLLLNPDVMVERETIGSVLDALDSESDVGAATCRLLLPSGDLDPACRRSEPTLVTALAKQLGISRLYPGNRILGRYNLTYLDPDVSYDVDSGTGAFLMLRRRALQDAGGRLDERYFLYGEDLDLCRRIREAGYRIRYWPAVTALHVKGSGRIRDGRTTRHFYRAMWTYYRKWGRFRSNPVVLSGLGGMLVALGSVELARNAVRRRLQAVDEA
jgi:N-acetylglucosaminyl-diphospho-decaprenol L-rhamnosyltransferase